MFHGWIRSTGFSAFLVGAVCSLGLAAGADGPGRASEDVPEEPATPVTDHKAGKDASPATTPKTAEAAPSRPTPDAPPTIGQRLAPGMVDLVRDEVVAASKQRGNEERFNRFQAYAAMKLRTSSAPYTGSELAGNCRLGWYEHLMQNILKAPSEAEEFTRTLHSNILADRGGLAQILPLIAAKLDLLKHQPRPPVVVKTPQEALDAVRQSLAETQAAYVAALAPLTKGEIRELSTNLYPVMVSQNSVGHTLNDRGTGRRLCDLMEKMDRNSWIVAAEALSPLADPKFLAVLKQMPEPRGGRVDGVTGSALKIDTPAGAIVIGGRDANTYSLDQMGDVAAVIDLGGDDTYIDGVASIDRPVLVLLDLAGNDTYRATRPGVQGGALLAISMLVDLEGDDTYTARDLAQGSSLAGVGILIDHAGNDRYYGVRRMQGQTVGGLGILIDRDGSDTYYAGLWAQGMGGPLGFGMLDDLAGNDHYYCGGLYVNSYKPETPGYEGWGQGVGGGIRQCANGGIGVILDGAGDDIYEFDYLSHGGGYWGGLGFARDFGGNDKRLICQKAYDGRPRSEPLYQRFGCGWGCHYALGFLFEDSGDDVYEGSIMGTGMAWDCSVGMLFDFAGNDRYEAARSQTQGQGAQASFGLLFDYDGDDVYLGYGQGYASSGISYHDLPYCGGNFSFLIDYGGNDTYGCGARNNCFIQRGDTGGFLIDRPRRDEATGTADAKPAQGKAADVKPVSDGKPAETKPVASTSASR